MSLRDRRPRHQLLRRPAPVLLRQRRQGHGLARSRAIPSSRAFSRKFAPSQTVSRPRWSPRLDDELRAVVHDVIRLTPNIVEVVVRAPIAARAFQPGQFYRLQNYETLAPRTWTTPCSPWKVSRSPALRSIANEGLLSTIVLEMGGSSDLCAAAQARRAGHPDGPHRHAHRNAVQGNGAAGRRRPRQRRALLDRPEAARRRLARHLLRRLQEDHRPLQGRRNRKGRRRRGLVSATKRPASRPAASQDHAFVGNIVDAMAAYGARRTRRHADPAALGGPPDRHRLRRHDARRPAGAPRRAAGPISSPTTTPSAASTRRCSA